MQFEMAHLSCPLCKRHLPSNTPEHTLSTRLCEPCQTMVLTAFRGENSIVAASTAVHSQNGAAVVVDRDPASFEHGSLAASFEDRPADQTASETEPDYPILFVERDPVRFYEDEDTRDRIQTIEMHSSAVSENGSSGQRGVFTESVQSVGTVYREYADAEDSRLTVSPYGITEAVGDPDFTAASIFEDRGEDPKTNVGKAETDPWEAPLAAWDYSHNEWPVLVGPTKTRSFKTLRLAIAVAAVLASVAAFYFLIYRPSSPQRRAATGTDATAQMAAVETRAAASDSGGVSRPEPTQSDGSSAATSQKTDTSAREAVATNDPSGQGRFSLQAASFPTLAGAEEFADKLKAAGVPSFVVPAELARRGKWFRVRVGRFNSAGDAQRFVGEAQQRARVAGLAVQLIVCQQDQP